MCECIKHGISETFRVLGYIPFVSTGSGALRNQYGLVKTISCVAAFAFCFAFSNCSKTLEDFQFTCFSGVIDGSCQMVRGSVEMVPFVGNIVCMVWDEITLPTYDRSHPVFARKLAEAIWA